MDIKRSLIYYKRANDMSREGRFEEAIDCYCDAFLNRLDSLCDSLEFLLFYKLQIVRYFSVKKRCFLSLPEGDMVSDLIKSSYDEIVDDLDASPFSVTPKGRERILENAKIVFPVQNDSIEEAEPLRVSK